MWGSRGDSRLGDWSDFVFKSKSSDVCLLKYPVETAAEFQLCWYLARLKQSNVQRDTLQEQWHTRSTPAPVDIWTVQRVAQTWPACLFATASMSFAILPESSLKHPKNPKWIQTQEPQKSHCIIYCEGFNLLMRFVIGDHHPKHGWKYLSGSFPWNQTYSIVQ